jgi:hypothetical protein
MKKKSKKIIIISAITVILIILSPFIYSEYWLIKGEYTKAGDIVEIMKVNNDSKYEVLRTIKNAKGEDEQIVVSRDLSEFTKLVGATKSNGNRSSFQLYDGRKCHMTHYEKSWVFCGKFCDYNIFVFKGATVEELLEDDNRECI